MHPVRKKRLFFIMFIALGCAIIVSLTLFALRQNLNLFFTPTEISQGIAPINKPIRAGGLVVKGSLNRLSNSLNVTFIITDQKNSLTVRYNGILPNLFKEGQGIVAKGSLDKNHEFIATEVLAKHDENYMPPEVADALKEAGHPIKQD